MWNTLFLDCHHTDTWNVSQACSCPGNWIQEDTAYLPLKRWKFHLAHSAAVVRRFFFFAISTAFIITCILQAAVCVANSYLDACSCCVCSEQINPFCADLRVKLELSSRPEEHHVANAAPYTEMSADKVPEIIPSNPWNSSASTKLATHKGGSISTADGKVVESSVFMY